MIDQTKHVTHEDQSLYINSDLWPTYQCFVKYELKIMYNVSNVKGENLMSFITGGTTNRYIS